MKIGLCTLAYRNLDLHDLIPAAKELGFDELEIWHQHLADKSDRELIELREQIANAGMNASDLVFNF